MRDGQTLPGFGFYPERVETPEPFGDRLVGELGFLAHRWLSRRIADPRGLAVQAGRRLEEDPMAGDIPRIRYRLRREGFKDDLIVECTALYRAALQRVGRRAPAPASLDAARVLLKGGVVQLAEPVCRAHALGLTAAAMVMRGTPVHLLTATDLRAKRLQDELQEPLRALEIAVGRVWHGMEGRARLAAYACPVVCATHREIATDYLRDQISIGSRPKRVLGALERLAGDAPGQRLLLRGLHCGLVDDADCVLLDDARMPLILSAETEESRERLNYEQALELARALKESSDYTLEQGAAELTATGAQRLDRLVQPLGGLWVGRQRREELIGLALEALHCMERNVHYRVDRGRVSFPEPPSEETDEDAGTSELLRRLVEVKEGCRLSGRRVVLGKISLPRFMRRYLHLAGVCADARNLEREFWSCYRLKTSFADGGPARSVWPVRVFAGREAKMNALLDAVRGASVQGCAVLVALRTPKELSAVVDATAKAGLPVGIVSGRGDETEHAALAGLDRPGTVVATLHPAERSIGRDQRGATPLHLVVAELHDAQRHVDQIRDSYAAGSGEILFSLEDEATKARLHPVIARLARAGLGASGEFSPERSRWMAKLAQRQAERMVRHSREEAMSAERHVGELLAFSGQRE